VKWTEALTPPRGEHIHHGYWPTPQSKATDCKEVAQINLIRLLLDTSALRPGSRVLDVGCGIGGTSRYLATNLACSVTGITISGKQVQLATRLTRDEIAKSKAQRESEGEVAPDADGFLPLGEGKVRFIELDAEKMGEFFADETGGFDAIWISEALSHFPSKELFFRNAQKVLKEGGRLVLADWFKVEGLGEKEFEQNIKPIEGRFSLSLFFSPSDP